MIVVVGGVVVGLLVFHVGVAYGERHAFGRMHGFHGAPPPGFSLFSHSFIPEGHGAVGTVTAVGTSSVTLQTREGNFENISIGDDTVIHGLTPDASSTLSVGQNVAIIGDPDDTDASQIDAKLIRVLPPISVPASAAPTTQ